jgi:hypothetical protein
VVLSINLCFIADPLLLLLRTRYHLVCINTLSEKAATPVLPVLPLSPLFPLLFSKSLSTFWPRDAIGRPLICSLHHLSIPNSNSTLIWGKSIEKWWRYRCGLTLAVNHTYHHNFPMDFLQISRCTSLYELSMDIQKLEIIRLTPNSTMPYAMKEKGENRI